MNGRKDWSWPGEFFWRGALGVEAELPPGYTPPSASMNPGATVTPWPCADAGETQPYAQITRVGRWRYEICIVCNPGAVIEVQYGGEWYGAAWRRHGRRRAEAKARRELARYRVGQERETWTIT